MTRRAVNAWLMLSAVWVLYGCAHAAYYWIRWGQDFVPPEKRWSLLLLTTYEIVAAPALVGLLLLALIIVGKALCRIFGAV